MELMDIKIDDRSALITGWTNLLARGKAALSSTSPSIGFINKILPGGSRPGTLAGFDRLKDILAETTSRYEQNFLALGSNLQSILTNAGSLSKNTIDSVQKIAGDGRSSALNSLRDEIKTSLGLMEENQGAIAAHLADLERQGKNLTAISRTSRDLSKIALYLRVAGVNIGIEATRSEESRAMFSLTATEVTQLGARIMKVAEDIENDAGKARKVQGTVHREVELKLTELRKFSDDAARTVQDALSGIEQLMNSSIGAMDQAAGHSKTITAECGEIVVGIQFHDSMRQRLEHVIETFEEIEEMHRHNQMEDASHGPTDSRTDHRDTTYSLFKLQTTQVRMVVEEIETLYQKTGQSFEQIDREIGQLAEAISALTDVNPNDSKGLIATGSFSVLESSLKHLVSLMGQGNLLMDNVQKGVADAAETSRRLLTFMNKITSTAFEIKIQALNAIIKAAHLGGKGLTLVVLAHEMNNLSDKADAIVEDASEVYQRLSSQINMDKDTDPGCSRARQDAIITATTQTEEIFNQLGDASKQLKNEAQELQSLVRASQASLNFLPEMAKELGKCLAEMETKLRRFEAEYGEPDGSANAPNQDAINKAAGRYTMEQERLAHQQITDSGTIVDSTSSSASADSGDMELFGQPESPDDSCEPFESADAVDNQENTEGSVELFDSDSGDQGQPSPPPLTGQDEDLGDNVELF